ncbi:tRNA (adenosine(37)-N6)-threonylcarbamoyltransferase complex ATPase subunit type 1 TsaE [Lacibacter sediminis]|uniref:tRNA threonylcarbamoyladenosine biosynthesis protein TsaE n=1 Tax=Lacibacter sediminis TaxID=2760713 RepID=A0A7G5XMX0_9BACT|nr:tRNA (adenosine(37)-N6)-threonylcarbamoyltransferase complex ATPase subunit type 1 TsaE [Lacibacter sediminis]
MQLTFSLQNIREAAAQVWQQLQQYKVWAFEAPMGSGKTTFIHALCDVLGVRDAVGSPTFSIINQYQSSDGKMICHLDLYRMKDEEEAIEAGVEDVLYSGDLCLVEWPGKAADLFPDDTVYLSIEVIDANTRRITAKVPK